MFKLKNLSIKQKLILISFSTTFVVLLIGIIGNIIQGAVLFRKSAVRNLTIHSRIIGYNSAAALAFNDRESAGQILSALKANQNIVNAVIYTKEGEVFATFNRDGKEAFSTPKPQWRGYRFAINHLEALEDIVLDGEPIGAIYVRAELNELYNMMTWFAIVVGIVAAGAFFLAFVILTKLQKTITTPIRNLTEATRIIARGDYSHKVNIQSNDEIKELADSFNKMTEDIRRYQAEKEKILKDMHDGIGGITTNIKLLSELAQKGSSIKDMKNALKTISGLSQEGLTEIRGFIQSLDIKDTTWQDMAAELRSFGSNMIESHGLMFNMKGLIGDAGDQPNSLLYLNLFRTYKEALTNIIKHSKAKSVDVLFSVNKEKIILSVKDDGVGLKEKEKSAGRGLTNMIMRARELGGQLTILSDKGTNITLEIFLPVKS
ncbi:MAG: hypothetical protein A2Z50_01465 [Nitrospirae bacterium RBG_19FT_COMBO_42_15]|nr:MAG: hypothetical protein A2Z50_01465 [Nitrospirae bacterium RBG_19FT_COMBO_42_15]